MRKLHGVIPALLLLIPLSGALQEVQAQSYDELAGGWIITNWSAPDGTMNDSRQPGLFVFSPLGHYSIMYVPGTEARERYEGEEQTDEDTLYAYSTIIANSGRYIVEGNQITFEAFVAKDPNYMLDFNPAEGGNAVVVSFTLSEEENPELSLEWLDGPFASAGQKATLRRAPAAPGAEGGM